MALCDLRQVCDDDMRAEVDRRRTIGHMVTGHVSLDERGAEPEDASSRWRRELIALGVSDADIAYCEHALWTFAGRTTHPRAVVVAAGRELLRSQVRRGEPLFPTDPDAWASQLLARFQSPKFATYWMVLPEWVQLARRVWSRPGTDLLPSAFVGADPFAEPPPSFRLHPMDLPDAGGPPNAPAGEGAGASRPSTDVRRIGDAVTLTRAMGRAAEGRWPSPSWSSRA